MDRLWLFSRGPAGFYIFNIFFIKFLKNCDFLRQKEGARVLIKYNWRKRMIDYENSNNIITKLLIFCNKTTPKYISNAEIRNFFIMNKIAPQNTDFFLLETCFANMSLPRYIFYQWKTEYNDFLVNVDEISIQNDQSNKVIERRPSPNKKLQSFPREREFIDHLKAQRYAFRSINLYRSVLCLFNEWLKNKYSITLEQIQKEHVFQYALFLINERNISISYQKNLRAAVKYYTLNILQRTIIIEAILKSRRRTKLPNVLTKAEIQAIIMQIFNLKHRLAVSLLYSAGLRVSEVINLKIKDINFENLTLTIRQSKGHKDRISIFSATLVSDLKLLTRERKPEDYVFYSNWNNHKPLAIRSLQNIFTKALKTSHIHRTATCHDLRHSFATHLLENGVDIRYIQELLGHKNLETTTIYTKVSHAKILSIVSPL